MNNPEVIPELKERCWIEGGYVLTTPENYKLISLFRLYSGIYHFNEFEWKHGQLVVAERRRPRTWEARSRVQRSC
jgi:hypothetical protein